MMRHDRNDEPSLDELPVDTQANADLRRDIHSPRRALARIRAAEDEVERLRAEIRDRESERADLRDRVQKAEAQVARVEALHVTCAEHPTCADSDDFCHECQQLSPCTTRRAGGSS